MKDKIEVSYEDDFFSVEKNGKELHRFDKDDGFDDMFDSVVDLLKSLGFEVDSNE